MNTLNESYLLLSLLDRDTIRQEVNPEMTVLDHPSADTSANSRLGRSLAVVCFQSFLLLWGHIVPFWMVI